MSIEFLRGRWADLFDHNLPDSLRPRSHDIESLLEELEAVAGLAATHEQHWARHVRLIREEIEGRASEARPEAHLKLWVSRLNELPYAVVSRRAALKRRELAYPEWLRTQADCLHELLANDKRLAATRTLSAIATYLNRDGITAAEATARFGDQVDLRSACSRISQLMTCEPQEWECAIEVRGTAAARALRQAGIRTKTDKLPATVTKGLTADSTIAHAVSEATRPRVAAAGLVEAVRTAVDLYNIADNRESLRLGERAAVWWGQGPVWWVDVHHRSRLYGRRRPDGFVGKALDQGRRRLDRKVSAVLSCLSRSPDMDPKLRLANLWMALEALFGADGTGPADERIARTLVPLICLKRTQRLVVFLCTRLQAYFRKTDQRGVGRIFSSDTRVKVKPAETLRLLCRPKDHEDCGKITRAVGEENLRNRLFELWRELHDPAELARSLDASHRRVTQQLARIYRARNLVVHRGEEPGRLGDSLDNLEYYAVTGVGVLIESADKYGELPSEHLVEVYAESYSELVHRIKDKSETVTDSDLLLDRGRRKPVLLWPSLD